MDQPNQTVPVVIYTTPTCAFCHMAEEHFKSKNIEYKKIDIADPANQESLRYVIEHAGQAATPYITVGDEGVLGFNPPKIDELLKKAGLI